MSKLSMRFTRAIAALIATLALLAASMVVTPSASAAEIDEIRPDNNQSKYVEGTDPAAWLFDPLRVHRIDIQISQNSFNILNASSYNSKAEYQAASMKFTPPLVFSFSVCSRVPVCKGPSPFSPSSASQPWAKTPR